tara:strand:+ start:5885 stop:7138 length:1254 start_codon:yes stop_codon:yes gene_type:complete
MSKVNLEGSEIRIKFKKEIDSTYGTGNFTKVQAKEAADKAGLNETEFKSICTHVLRFFKVEKDVYSFSSPTETVVVSEKKNKENLKKDFDIINSDPVVSPVKKKEAVIDNKVKSVSNTVVNLVPKKDPTYVTWGHFKDIKSILERKIFYPVFITGLSGNGKTSMVREVCAKLKRDLVRVNITVETDEDDLLGGFRLVNGETVWQDGPLVVAMKNGSVALIDEVDLASHKIMCLQPILEGQPIYLKKINEVVYPQPGFNVIATANTKGKGSSDGRFMGTNILNEAFLDRFAATFYQEYPSVASEAKILNKHLAFYEMKEEDFVNKLVKWADVIRKSFKQGAVDEIVTTRRLIDIIKSYSIFGNKMKAVTMCLERFDDETRDSFADLYTKVDAGASLEELTAEDIVIEEADEIDQEVPS